MPLSPELAALVAELDRVIPEVADWKLVASPELSAAGARSYIGHAAGWKLVVVDFDIEPQGFPEGSRGHDGAATHPERRIVYHLTREQATRAYTAAALTHGGVAIKVCDVVDQGSPVKDDPDADDPKGDH